jgi:hypothetical protein
MVVKEETLEEMFRKSFNSTDQDLIIRGIVKKDAIKQAESQNKNYYYIDTGYLGNFPSLGNQSGKKIWHRIVKNDLQHCYIRDVPGDRWNNLVKQDPRLLWKGWKNYDKKILLVLPNPKATRFYNIECDQWISDTSAIIRKYSPLPIEVRIKGTRSERGHGYSIYDAFDTGVYATVAFNSIAALESVLYGIPAFVSVPCAATPIASYDLSQLNSPFKPDKDLILKQCHNVAYGQFTVEEITSGDAYHITEKYSQ